MADKTITAAVERVQAAVDTAARRLTKEQYRKFLEELIAEAEGWRMQLDEDEEGDTDDRD